MQLFLTANSRSREALAEFLDEITCSLRHFEDTHESGEYLARGKVPVTYDWDILIDGKEACNDGNDP